MNQVLPFVPPGENGISEMDAEEMFSKPAAKTPGTHILIENVRLMQCTTFIQTAIDIFTGWLIR